MFEELSESVAEREKFRIAANKLLNQCFVLYLYPGKPGTV